MANMRREITDRYYQKHRVEILGRQAERRQRNKESVARWRKAHPEDYKIYRQRQSVLRRNRSLVIKQEVMAYYGGGKCACVICGENRLACLSLDHIMGGGTKETRKRRITSYSYYLWLKNQGWPSGLQTLCMNCQFVKRFQNKEDMVRFNGETNPV